MVGSACLIQRLPAAVKVALYFDLAGGILSYEKDSARYRTSLLPRSPLCGAGAGCGGCPSPPSSPPPSPPPLLPTQSVSRPTKTHRPTLAAIVSSRRNDKDGARTRAPCAPPEWRRLSRTL